ncbi:hypothetical protein [Bradyrhizobium sp.]|uniref:hypothetical protein n=1 Tax=Bradyrhizobium sp. TaxID=376 RepID=UPI0025C64ADE|nr:hypothetical protein [Bradyrhizobium sp.]MCA3256254.1 hypothetical protein [Alphaproteobacteria bacterium]MCA3571925.1 hypothetical protein [Bradyrhizobium sp.]
MSKVDLFGDRPRARFRTVGALRAAAFRLVEAQTGLWNPSCGRSLLTTKKNAGRLLDGVQHDGFPS